MPSPSFHIGLDFGTSQTKVCVQHLSAQPKIHEFVAFRRPDGSDSLFLPSQVAVTADDTLACGYECQHAEGDRYSYFKIASAEDVDFHVFSTGAGEPPGEARRYNAAGFQPYTPELLSVFFLTYVLLYVKEQFRARQQRSQRGGLLGQVVRQPERTDAHFTVQLGLPTEYSSEVNLLRRRKFETMLLLASKLEEAVGTLDQFRAERVDRLRRRVDGLVQEVQEQATSPGAFDRLINEHGLAVFPESAAGLTFLIKTGRLEAGYYAALDIGGGSTDVSFFRVNRSGSTSYLASESLLMAANDVYRHFARSQGGGLAAHRQGERSVRRLVHGGAAQALSNRRYRKAVRAVTCELHKALYDIFNQRVYWLFNQGPALVNEALGTYKGQPCFVYGGGAQLPVPGRMREIVIHDNGLPHGPEELMTRIVRKHLDQYVLAQDLTIRPDPEALSGHVPTLVVAYGLSFPHHHDETLWDDDQYRRARYDHVLLPHPVNEDRYVYDVIEREWVGGGGPHTPNTPPQGVAHPPEPAPTPPAGGRTTTEQGTEGTSRCPVCGEMRSFLLEHVACAHGDEALEQFVSRHPEHGDASPQTARYCDLCDIMLLSAVDLRKHRRREHPWTRCLRCGRTFRRKRRDGPRTCPDCWNG